MNGCKQSVWVPILRFIKDIKQQAVSVGFFGVRAKFSCCFCDAGLNNYGDLIRDIVTFGQYHYQVLDLQEESTCIVEKVKKYAFLAKNGLKPKSPIIQTLTPGLDIVMGYPSEPAHSKF